VGTHPNCSGADLGCCGILHHLDPTKSWKGEQCNDERVLHKGRTTLTPGSPSAAAHGTLRSF